MLPLPARVDLRAMAIKEYSALLKLHHQIVLVSYPRHSLGTSYSSAEMQSVYSAALTDWVSLDVCMYVCMCVCVCVYTRDNMRVCMCEIIWDNNCISNVNCS